MRPPGPTSPCKVGLVAKVDLDRRVWLRSIEYARAAACTGRANRVRMSPVPPMSCRSSSADRAVRRAAPDATMILSRRSSWGTGAWALRCRRRLLPRRRRLPRERPCPGSRAEDHRFRAGFASRPPRIGSVLPGPAWRAWLPISSMQSSGTCPWRTTVRIRVLFEEGTPALAFEHAVSKAYAELGDGPGAVTVPRDRDRGVPRSADPSGGRPLDEIEHTNGWMDAPVDKHEQAMRRHFHEAAAQRGFSLAPAQEAAVERLARLAGELARPGWTFPKQPRDLDRTASRLAMLRRAG